MRKMLGLLGLLILVGIPAADGAQSLAASFAPAKSYPTGSDPNFVAIGDLSGDDKPDLVTLGAKSVSVLLNRATAASGPSSTT